MKKLSRTERKFLTQTDSGRLIIIQRRKKILQKIAQNIYPGLKFDWQAFPEENIRVRYSKSGRKIKRLQALYRECQRQETETIEKILEK